MPNKFADCDRDMSDCSDPNEEAAINSIRRIVRNKRKPKKYGDFVEMLSKTKLSQSSDDDECSIKDKKYSGQQCLQKPTALFSSDDVEGQHMFKFKSRHTKSDLQNKVKAAVNNSPSVMDQSLRTPQKNVYSNSKVNSLIEIPETTPRHVKSIIKKRIIRQVESDRSDSDFSASSSDFIPDGSDSETETSSSKDSDEEVTKKSRSKIQISKNVDMKTKTRDSDYIVKSDDYFMMHSSKKITTSDHTLARIKNLNINENVQKVETHISDEHKSKMTDLSESYESLFDRWLFVLCESFNIILYGIGSKRSVLQEFQIQKLQNFPCIVVNGFFPSLTIKSILETIVIDLLENTHVPSHLGDVVNLIDTQLNDNNVDLFLIIHNIDGLMLRNSKTQTALASLSQIKNVHTIATIDHINAPLLWDHSKLSKFKFTWWDVTTFKPYIEETSFENSLMTHRSGALQLSSLTSVYQSLTTNAKGIFNVLMSYQLENYKGAHYQGLPFKELYSKCREQFLVSSDIALRAQLTEFLDHKLVKTKRTLDGSENLVIPIENSLLQQFLEQQN